MVNPRIAAVVTADDMPYRSRHDAPVLRRSSIRSCMRTRRRAGHPASISRGS